MGWAPGAKEPEIWGKNGSGEASSSMALYQEQLRGTKASSPPGPSSSHHSRSRPASAGSGLPREGGDGRGVALDVRGQEGPLFSRRLHLFLKTVIGNFICSTGLRSHSLG